MGATPSDDGVPTARRPKERIRRTAKLGPLSLSEEEAAAVRQAAARDGMTPGAWAAQAVVAVARGERTAVPADVRGALMVLVQTRAQVAALCLALRRQAEVQDLADKTIAIMRRLEAAADALDRRSRT